MLPLKWSGPTRHGDGGRARELDRAGSAIGSTCNIQVPHQQCPDVERVFDAEALTLLTSVQDLRGAGVVRDRAYWAIEAERCGTDWPGILATVAAALDLCQRRPAPEWEVSA